MKYFVFWMNALFILYNVGFATWNLKRGHPWMCGLQIFTGILNTAAVVMSPLRKVYLPWL